MFQRNLLVGACVALANMQALAAPLQYHGMSDDRNLVAGGSHHGHGLMPRHFDNQTLDTHKLNPHAKAHVQEAHHDADHARLDHGLWWEHDNKPKPDDPKPAVVSEKIPVHASHTVHSDAHKIGDPQSVYRDHTLELDVTKQPITHPPIVNPDEDPQV